MNQEKFVHATDALMLTTIKDGLHPRRFRLSGSIDRPVWDPFPAQNWVDHGDGRLQELAVLKFRSPATWSRTAP